MNNQRGSISIFALLITSGLILAFALYMNDLQSQMKRTNGLRRIERASHNALTLYNQDLYMQYGLLALDPSDVNSEVSLTLNEELISLSGKSLLPYMQGADYAYGVDKGSDLLDLPSTMDQIRTQSMMQVPKAYLMGSDLVKDLFEKASLAKQKIKDLNKNMHLLENLKSLNKKLGAVNKRIKEVDQWFDIRVTRRGNLSVDLSELNSLIAETEKYIMLMSRISRTYSKAVDKDIMELESEKHLYPEGFVENVKSNLLDSKLDGGEVVTEKIHIHSLSPSGQVKLQVEKKVRQLVSGGPMFESIMETYGESLASLYQAKNDLESLEEELLSRYEAELEDMKFLERRDAREFADYIESNIKEEVEDLFESVVVETMSENKKRVDSDLENYAEKTMEHTLGDDKNPYVVQKKEDLPSARISREIFKELPSQIYEDTYNNTNLVDRVLLTEYILGTFRNRLSLSDEQALDFYNKTDRQAFFEAGEVEYIITGNKDERLNRVGVVSKIYLMREAANLIHVYTSTEKQKLALQIATAIAHPLWTKPLVHNGLLIGWASIESAEDVRRLIDGQKIYTFKYDESMWYTSFRGMGSTKISSSTTKKVTRQIDGTKISLEKTPKNKMEKKKDGKGKTQDILSNEQGYVFYLRLLLNTEPGKIENYILRSLDIIELNMSLEEETDVAVYEMWQAFKVKLTWEAEQVEYEAIY